MPYLHQDGEFKYHQDEEEKKTKSKEIDSQSNLPQQSSKQYHGGSPTEKKQTNQPYQPFLNPTDEKILRECYSEAFYKRCLPLTAVSALVVSSLLKKKILKSPFLSYSTACFTSYVLGTMSYREATIKRIMESSSDSPFARGLRERKGYRSAPSNRETKTVVEHESSLSQDMWHDKEFASHHESEPTMFNDLPLDEEKKPKNTTYDELRSKNRANYKF